MAAAQSFGAGLSPPNAAVSICSHTFAQASLSLVIAASSKSLSSPKPTKKYVPRTSIRKPASLAISMISSCVIPAPSFYGSLSTSALTILMRQAVSILHTAMRKFCANALLCGGQF
jgi:hypothetical protein